MGKRTYWVNVYSQGVGLGVWYGHCYESREVADHVCRDMIGVRLYVLRVRVK